jgi:hypothetical protein
MIKNVVNFEGLYWVDSTGNVLTKNWRNTGKEAVLRPATDKKGYLRVALVKNGKLHTLKVHRIVASAFIYNPENKPQVNHKNGNKKDNSVQNLEWCTQKENAIHAVKNGLWDMKIAGWNKGITTIKGSQIGTSLLKEFQVIEIRNKFKPRKYTRKMLAKEYNVTEACIADIVRGKSWKHLCV